MKTVLVISTGASIRYLKKSFIPPDGYTLVYKSINGALQKGIKTFIDEIILEYSNSLVGVIGLTDSASILACVISQKLSLNYASLESLFNCQNKYLFRKKTTCESLGLVTRELLTHTKFEEKWCNNYINQNNLSYPLFLKPVKGALSQLAFTISDSKTFLEVLKKLQKSKIKQGIYKSLQKELGIHFPHLDAFIVEPFITGDIQVTIDGYVFEHEVTFFGMTKSEFLINSLSFDRFEFPYHSKYSKKIELLVTKSLSACGFSSGLFNAEIIINSQTDEIAIIEINSRPSSQFLYLIESVTGYNPLQAGIEISTAVKPMFTPDKRYNKVAVCFILRKTKNAFIKRIPTIQEINKLQQEYPTLKFSSFVSRGKMLSSYPQDTDTFRYAQVKIICNSFEECYRKYRLIKRDLDTLFIFD